MCNVDPCCMYCTVYSYLLERTSPRERSKDIKRTLEHPLTIAYINASAGLPAGHVTMLTNSCLLISISRQAITRETMGTEAPEHCDLKINTYQLSRDLLQVSLTARLELNAFFSSSSFSFIRVSHMSHFKKYISSHGSSTRNEII